jgi:hypothetical protein
MTEQTINEAIDGAEEVRDPLNELIDKTRIDPGAPFTPEVLERLAALKKDDRAAFETLRAQLKEAGCRVTALDEALAEESGALSGLRPTQADILLDLAQAAELFHTPDGTGFADIGIEGHRETWPVRAKSFRRWLVHRFFAETDGGAPSSEALRSALDVIEARAHFDAPERIVHVRVGGADGRIYLDLCNKTWQAVEIDSTGWRVIDTPPVRFRRSAGMMPLPEPVAGGSIEELRAYLNVRSDADFIMVVAWVLAALRPNGPYPVLSAFGEGGTAKSTLLRIVGGTGRPQHSVIADTTARRPRLVHQRGEQACTDFRQHIRPARLDLRYAVAAGDRRRLQHAGALHRRRGSIARRHPADRACRYRGFRPSARPGRSRHFPDTRADPGGGAATRVGTVGGIQR